MYYPYDSDDNQDECIVGRGTGICPCCGGIADYNGRNARRQRMFAGMLAKKISKKSPTQVSKETVSEPATQVSKEAVKEPAKQYPAQTTRRQFPRCTRYDDYDSDEDARDAHYEYLDYIEEEKEIARMEEEEREREAQVAKFVEKYKSHTCTLCNKIGHLEDRCFVQKKKEGLFCFSCFSSNTSSRKRDFFHSPKECKFTRKNRPSMPRYSSNIPKDTKLDWVVGRKSSVQKF